MRKLFILALLIAPLAIAQVAKEPEWIIPIQRVNGDPLPIEEIAGYDLECYRVPSGETVYTTGLPATATEHATAAVFDAGDFQCRMRTLDTDGLISVWRQSNVFTVGRCETSDCRPDPPQFIVIPLTPYSAAAAAHF